MAAVETSGRQARALPAVERVRPGLWSLPVPIPDNPLGYTLVYLLASDDGPVLVDAGWNDPASERALAAGVAACGADLAEVVGVVVTHHHPDHHGLAGHVRDVSGCWVAMHEQDADVVRRYDEYLAGGGEVQRDRTWEMLHVAGAPTDEIETLLAHQDQLDVSRPAIPDRTLRDGDVVRVDSRELHAIWTPGHSPGHTCFWVPDVQCLLAGDHLLPTITPHVGLHDATDDADDPLGDFLDSLDRIASLGVGEVLPAHEHRFEDVDARIASVRGHHDDRLAEVMAALAGGARTLWELAEAMTWNRPWAEIPPLMRRVATSEAAAHVRRLERRGVVERVGDAPIRYRASVGFVPHPTSD